MKPQVFYLLKLSEEPSANRFLPNFSCLLPAIPLFSKEIKYRNRILADIPGIFLDGLLGTKSWAGESQSQPSRGVNVEPFCSSSSHLFCIGKIYFFKLFPDFFPCPGQVGPDTHRRAFKNL